MKIVGILARPDFTSGIQFARQLLAYLETRKIQVLLPSYLAEALGRNELACAPKKMKADFVITLGGDGTTLYAASHLPPAVPLLPVNLESFGFLSECEINEVEALLTEVLAGRLSIQQTPRLASWFKKKRLLDASNEIALFPIDQGRPGTFSVQLDDVAKFTFRADGFLIATPMGSTGHAFSLGGPFLDLQLDGLLLIAAAPLRQGFHPLIIPSESAITVQCDKTANLFIDGDNANEVPPNRPITVKKSNHSLRILRRPSGYYSRLQGKLLRC